MSIRHLSLCFLIVGTSSSTPVDAGEGGGSGIQPGRVGTITGIKWEDTNGNGQRDPDEPGLPGVTIYLDTNLNGVLDRGEPSKITLADDSATPTNEDGEYWFTDLPPGRYLVREVVPDGFQQTFPSAPLQSNALPDGAGGGSATVVSPAAVNLLLAAKEASVQEVSLTILPQCIRPYDVDVVAPAAPTGMVQNLTGVLVNSCGGQTTTFSVQFTGDGGSHDFTLEFVDAEFGGEPLGSIPVRIGSAPDDAHVVQLEPGGVIQGIDFGNQPLSPGTITGRKWEDSNGNGQREPDEPGLPGVTIYLDLNRNGALDPTEPSTLTLADDSATPTDEKGQFWFTDLRPGTYLVREVVPDGFEQTFPSGPLRGNGLPDGAGGGSPTVVSPATINRVLEAGETFVEEVSLTILPQCIRPYDVDVVALAAPTGMVQNLTGVLVNSCGGQTTTFSVQFTGDGGSHDFTLEFVDAEFGGEPLGSIPVRILGAPDDAHLVHLEPGGLVEELDFGNQQLSPGTISGRKWEDRNGNGRRELDEPGLPGVTIYLDLNRNGAFDRDEPSTTTLADDPATPVFDESGRYWLEGLQPGNYVVREVVPDGFQQTFPSGPLRGNALADGAGGGSATVVSPAAISRVLEAGETFVEDASLTILPVCIRPFNVDVVAPDAPTGMVQNLSGVQINSCGGQTTTFSVQFTGDGGSHDFTLEFVDAEFGGEPLGSIPVRILGAPDDAHLVHLEPGGLVEELDFGNQQLSPGTISGRKWEDRNGNGRRELDEPGLPGVTIYLDLNRNGAFDRDEPSTTTLADDPATPVFDESGRYWLEGLQPGNYVVREVVPDGFQQTFPSGPLRGNALADGAGGGSATVVSPAAISRVLEAGETFVEDASLTILPVCIRPFNVDVVAPDAPTGMVQNLSGVQINSCGGQTTTFSVQFTGDGGSHDFTLEFVDAEFGGEPLGSIPVRISSAPDDAHAVTLEPGGVIQEIDFGNQRLGGLLFLRGDCDNDGFVGGSVNDSVFQLNWAFNGGPAPECLAACDADGDGFVGGSVNDPVYYLNWAFSGGPRPEPPFPSCGPGTAADEALGCETTPAACSP